jgi:Tol biopolymer transport system component
VQQLGFDDVAEFVRGWALDGEAIVFTTDRDGNSARCAPMGLFTSDRGGARGGYGDACSMRADGSDQLNRMSTPGVDIHPDWQPLPWAPRGGRAQQAGS